MKWLIYISSALALLILLIVLIGLMLPRSHRTTRMARFNQPPEIIFAAIIGPQDWRPGITTTELPTNGGPRQWQEHSSHGTITFQQTACDPLHLYRSQIIDKNLPYSGTWTWEITPTPQGCTCRITEDGEVKNPIFRFVSQFIIGHTKTMDDYLNALGKKFQQSVQIEN